MCTHRFFLSKILMMPDTDRTAAVSLAISSERNCVCAVQKKLCLLNEDVVVRAYVTGWPFFLTRTQIRIQFICAHSRQTSKSILTFILFEAEAQSKQKTHTHTSHTNTLSHRRKFRSARFGRWRWSWAEMREAQNILQS